MLVKDIKRSSLFLGPILILIYLAFSSYKRSEALGIRVENWIHPPVLTSHQDDVVTETQEPSAISNTGSESSQSPEPLELQAPTSTPAHESLQSPDEIQSHGSSQPEGEGQHHDHNKPQDMSPVAQDVYPQHQEIFSVSTQDKKFFSIDFGEFRGMNPSIVPHPTLQDTWIVVAQKVKADHETPSLWFSEITCDATFQDNVLRCLRTPNHLPVAATFGERCEGDLAYMNTNIGPHDARVFLGPETPYIVYGSNSMHTCFGQFSQDFRILVDSGYEMTGLSQAVFRAGTELQRPLPWGTIEKNWFLFWDFEGQLYCHYDIAPKRVFALLNPDGSAGPDLSPGAAQSDEACLAKYLPKTATQLESVHQATNSLKITMCRRQDPACKADESNTFIFTIYQHKAYYGFHSVYEPYLMVFNQRAPFKIHSMSERPIWIHGRERNSEKNTSDMFYVTSMSWKNRERKYHGYLDDELFIGFGIEDEKSGGIDVRAEDVLQNLGICNSV
ncbi:hypothetical protein BGZ63DRAFT_354715 [Mariannaea sp. PMI_226]|nr:hypothetical protein BGZ63DRAFT_354715 [Mariannaea sp. PMI_226]